MKYYTQNFDLNLYKTFCAVAENNSISKAAEILFISPQAVSYNIKQLEKILDSKLFFRVSKGVILTPEAEKLHLHIKQSLNIIINGEGIFKEGKELRSGHIYIGCNSAVFDIYLHSYVTSFHKLYPNIKFHFVSKPISDFNQMLKEHEIDMFFCTLQNSNNIKTFSKKIFAKMSLCFVCNKDFKFLSDKKDISLEELAKYHLLLLDKNSYIRSHLEKCFKSKNIDLNPVMDFSNIYSLIKLIKNGVGIGYVTRELVADDIKAGNLFEIPVSEALNSIDIGIIYDKNHLTFVASKFIELF